MLDVDFCGVKLSSPIFTASGCSNYGEELKDFGDLSKLAGVVGKTITPLERSGNPMPRIAETSSGMINAIGLENVGIERFLTEIVPSYLKLPCAKVVNIAGFSLEEYGDMAASVTGLGFDIIEVNGSCPNVEKGGKVFCADVDMVTAVTKLVKSKCSEPIMIKLSPNVSDVVEIAKAAEEAGADALSLINTLVGTTVNWREKKRGTAWGTGGLSGPAIKPVALRMVDQVCSAVSIPVCAIGGISNAEDILEFMSVGASVVQMGTALFVNPSAAFDAIEDLKRLLTEEGISHISDVVGSIK